MININLLDILIDYTMLIFEFALITIRIPLKGCFREFSLFAIVIDDEFYLEIFFVPLIGKKHYEN